MTHKHGLLTNMHKLQMHLCDADGSVFGRVLPGNPIRLPADLDRARELLSKLAGSMRSSRDTQGDVPAGMTFLGQFIDHDITLDVSSELGRNARHQLITNVRTPSLDLDCVFGAGPDGTPHLYSALHRGFLLMGTRQNALDLPRNCDGTALIGDPRNDENAIVSQIQGLWIRFYNIVFNQLQKKGKLYKSFKHLHEDRAQLAKLLTRWHYQWIVLHEFLPAFVDPGVCNEVLQLLKRHRHPRPFTDKTAPIPVEFSVAAYRFGHATVQNKYQMSKDVRVGLFKQEGDEFGLPAFGPKDKQFNIDWRFMFDIHRAKVDPQMARPIGTEIGEEVFDLPFVSDEMVMGDQNLVIPAAEAKSLPHRNIYRDRFGFELASGQMAAAAMGLTPIDRDQATRDAGLDKIPLWYYCLQEAAETAEGKLGQVGGRIVATVLMRLLKNDPGSVWHHPEFEPCFGNNGKAFGMGHVADFVDEEWASVKVRGDLTCSYDDDRVTSAK